MGFSTTKDQGMLQCSVDCSWLSNVARPHLPSIKFSHYLRLYTQLHKPPMQLYLILRSVPRQVSLCCPSFTHTHTHTHIDIQYTHTTVCTLSHSVANLSISNTEISIDIPMFCDTRDTCGERADRRLLLCVRFWHTYVQHSKEGSCRFTYTEEDVGISQH